MAESTAPPRRGPELELRLECLAINGDINYNNNNADVISNVSDPPAVQIVGDANEARRGARRMAAMRRRRVKGGGGGSRKPELAGEEKMTTTNETITAASMEGPVLVVEAEESSPTVGATNSVLESVTLGTTAKDIDIDEEDIEQKKYMGVARMRRKRLKEEKEKRLQEIADDGDSPRSTVELIATLGLSARQGVDEARGARRMAAMRRRRVKGGGGGNSKPELAGEEKMTMMTTTNEFITAVSMEEPVLVVEAVELIAYDSERSSVSFVYP